MAEIVWSPAALRQLEEIAEAISLESVDAARRMVAKLVERVERLERFPRSGKRDPDLNLPGYRQLWSAPCWVYYRVTPATVFIVHVRRAERLFRVEKLFEE